METHGLLQFKDRMGFIFVGAACPNETNGISHLTDVKC